MQMDTGKQGRKIYNEGQEEMESGGGGHKNQGKCERQLRLQWRTWGHWRTGGGDGRLREQGGK